MGKDYYGCGTINKKGERVFGEWSGNPKGVPEVTTKCIKEVASGWRHAQCSRPRGHGAEGLFCKQHAKEFPEKKEVE